MPKRSRPTIAQALEDLATADLPPLDALQALSDLDSSSLDEFKHGWPGLPEAKRLATLQALGELAEDSFALDINAVSRAALDDPAEAVRAAAIRNLWEDQGEDLIDPLLNYLAHDAAEAVRAAAATALGIYVYLGETEELSEEQTRLIEDTLLEVFDGRDTLEVRRHALESLGFSPRPEAVDAIDLAHESGDEFLRASALFAMGRSLDAERWGESVTGDLSHSEPQVRFEAVRAAGELQLEEAVEGLGSLLHDPAADVQEMAVWSLGEIGGDDARRFLQDRLATADDELTELIEDALANADMVDGSLDLGMLGPGDDDDEQARKAHLN